MTTGVISALDREMDMENTSGTFIQTDAAINPGNSGGGLFNEYGQLVGIVEAKSTGSNVEGLGFAIPVNSAREIISQLIDYGYVLGRVDPGMTFIDLTNWFDAMRYGVLNPGVYIASVDNSNAERAGFKPGDLIYTVGGTQVTSIDAVENEFEKYSVGDTVDVEILRDNALMTLHLTLAEKTKGTSAEKNAKARS